MLTLKYRSVYTRLGRNVKEAAGHNGLSSEGGSGLEIKVWESSRVKELIIRNIVGLYFPTPFDIRYGHKTYFGQWNVSWSDMDPFWGEALRAGVRFASAADRGSGVEMDLLLAWVSWWLSWTDAPCWPILDMYYEQEITVYRVKPLIFGNCLLLQRNLAHSDW